MWTTFILKLFCFSHAIKTKYTDMIREAQKIRLQSSHIDVKDMVHVKVETKKDITFTGTAGLTVGDWVEIEHDFVCCKRTTGRRYVDNIFSLVLFCTL